MRRMPVMKAQEMQRTRQTAVVMDLSDLEREAARIVSKAREQADQIIADAVAAASKEGARLREEARQAGRKEGLTAGTEAGQKQGHDEGVAAAAQAFAQLTDRWSKTLDVLQQHMPAHVADAKTDLVRLALTIAERVTHQVALREKAVAAATMEETMGLIGSARKIVLHVHPDEVALLQTYLPDLLAKMRTIESVELKPDETVDVGGCVARFGAGEVDARIKTQLERISAELLAGE